LLIAFGSCSILATQGCDALWSVGDLKFVDAMDSSLDSGSSPDSGFDSGSSFDSGSVTNDSGFDSGSRFDSGSGLDASADARSDSSAEGDSGCSCQTGLVCDQWAQCINPLVIDNFATCALQIPMISNRIGVWSDFGTQPVGKAFGVSKPPGTGWADTACGAWLTGGGTVTSNDYAGIGVTLNDGSAYSLAGYTGVTVTVETSLSVTFEVKMLDGYTFGYTIPGATGAVAHDVAFSTLTASPGTPSGTTLDLTQVTELEILAGNPASFGYTVHLLQLY
jgi:hypothetical protein